MSTTGIYNNTKSEDITQSQSAEVSEVGCQTYESEDEVTSAKCKPLKFLELQSWTHVLSPVQLESNLGFIATVMFTAIWIHVTPSMPQIN